MACVKYSVKNILLFARYPKSYSTEIYFHIDAPLTGQVFIKCNNYVKKIGKKTKHKNNGILFQLTLNGVARSPANSA